MSESAMSQTVAPNCLKDSASDRETEPPKTGSARQPAFRSFLTQGILSSRWLRPYCTPCQSRGAAFN